MKKKKEGGFFLHARSIHVGREITEGRRSIRGKKGIYRAVLKKRQQQVLC